MRVATLTAGYADGYPRHLSNVGAEMLVRGKRCPLLGRVTMDLMVIDVSHIPDVDVGDEVVLDGATRRRRNSVRRAGRQGRHDHLGNHDPNWPAREAGFCLILAGFEEFDLLSVQRSDH